MKHGLNPHLIDANSDYNSDKSSEGASYMKKKDDGNNADVQMNSTSEAMPGVDN
jgi:hypothetical protein